MKKITEQLNLEKSKNKAVTSIMKEKKETKVEDLESVSQQKIGVEE